jgi:hypothetical protein
VAGWAERLPKTGLARDQLATVISHFEVVAVQESRRNPKAMKRLFATLARKGM